jgi:hypothetical protein
MREANDHDDVVRRVVAWSDAFRTLFAVAIAIVFIANPASSQSLLKSEIAARTVTASGKLEACTIDFNLIYRDNVYKRGAPAGVSGSLTWAPYKAGVGLLLKVIGSDLMRGGANLESFHIGTDWELFRLSHAFLATADTSYLADQQMSCENPNGYCGVYGFSKATAIARIMADKFTINFNRHASGIDVSLPLDVSSGDQVKFFECMEKIINLAIEQAEAVQPGKEPPASKAAKH